MQRLGVKCKQLMTKEIQERLKDTHALFISSFSTMTVPDQEQLRKKLKEVNASLFVVKNRLAKQVFKQLDFVTLNSIMQGLTAIAIGGDDALCVSKTLMNFAGKNENFKILGGYLDGQTLNPDSIKILASIPSKEVLLARVVMGIKFPLQGLVSTLSATLKKFVLVINEIQKKRA